MQNVISSKESVLVATFGAAAVLFFASGCGALGVPSGNSEVGGAVATDVGGAAQPVRDFETDPQGREALRRIHNEILSAVTVSDSNMIELREISEIWPNHPEIVAELKLALTRRLDWEGLAKLYEGLPALNIDERAMLGHTYIKLGRVDEANAILVPLAVEDPLHIDVAYGAALGLYRSGDSVAASRHLDRLWNPFIHAKRVDALALRGKIFLEDGDLKRARSIFEQAIEIDDSLVSREAYDGLGRTLVALGEREAAAEVFDRLEAMNVGVSRMETQNLQQYTKIRAMIEAWEQGDLVETERLMDEILPVVDDRFKSLIYEYALELYNATGRPDKAREAAAEMARYEQMRIDR